jgi:L-amino acid N-acyltransferase YncA
MTATTDRPPAPPAVPRARGRARLAVQPVTFEEACRFVERHHRHHKPPQGWLFGCAVNDGERVVGVVMVGRPVARTLQDGYTVEVTRCCTDGTEHAASKLYAAAWRAARALGYRRLITYTLATEAGTSVKALGFRVVHQTAGGSWDCPSRPRVDKHPTGQKTLWERTA